MPTYRFAEIAVLNRTTAEFGLKKLANSFEADCDQPQYFAADFRRRRLFSVAEWSSHLTAQLETDHW